MLTRVTITGADDEVDPKALVGLSREFPFVEAEKVRLSAHLCGAEARRAMVAEVWVPFRAFQRYQLNGYSHGQLTDRFLSLAAGWGHIEFILQVRDEASVMDAALDAVRIGPTRTSLLFDPSGGRGVETFRWATPPLGVRMGYAGGIKPENVLDVLKEIGVVDAPFWIDLESGARDDSNQFSLTRVRSLLEKVAPFVVSEAS